MKKIIISTISLFLVVCVGFAIKERVEIKNEINSLAITNSSGTKIVGDGSGTIGTLDQWKSDGTNITQRIASKPIKLTGLEGLSCLGTDGSGIVGAGTCTGGSGSGGVGTTTPWTVGNLVMVSSNANVTSISTSTLVNWILPFTSYGASTSTVLGFTGGLFSTASSTFGSNTFFTSLSQGYAYIGSNGKLNTVASSSAAVGTATSLAANGANCSAGNAPLGVDASGAVESCFDVWTEVENTAAGYVASTRTLTVAGTANQITSSAGAQDLSANRTWTLSFPNQVIFPQYASTTNGFSTPYASSTDLRVGLTQGIAYIGSNQKLQTAATSTFSLSGFTNDLASLTATNGSLTFSGSYNGATARTVGLNLGNANTWTALQTFTNSSTTLGSFSYSSSTQLYAGGLTTCNSGNFLQWAAGTFACGTPSGSGTVTSVVAGIGFQNRGLNITGSGTLNVGIATSSNPSISGIAMWTGVGDASNPATIGSISTSTLVNWILPFTSYGASTSTVLGLTGGLFSTASSTFSSALRLSSLSQGFLYTGSTGLVQTVSTSTLSTQIFQNQDQRLGFSYATSTWTATTTILIGPAYRATTVDWAYCETDTGTVGVSLYDGTNRANYIATASTTINKFTYSSNNTFTAGETMRVDVGTPASSPTKIACSFGFKVTD